MGDKLSQRPEEDTSLENIIVVDNAPKVGPDRLNKLKAVLKKIFQRFGTIVTEFYPVNEDNETKGYVAIRNLSSCHCCFCHSAISLWSLLLTTKQWQQLMLGMAIVWISHISLLSISLQTLRSMYVLYIQLICIH